MEDSEIKHVNPKDLKSEEGAEDLVQSAKMRPYLHLADPPVKQETPREATDSISITEIGKPLVRPVRLEKV